MLNYPITNSQIIEETIYKHGYTYENVNPYVINTLINGNLRTVIVLGKALLDDIAVYTVVKAIDAEEYEVVLI